MTSHNFHGLQVVQEFRALAGMSNRFSQRIHLSYNILVAGLDYKLPIRSVQTGPWLRSFLAAGCPAHIASTWRTYESPSHKTDIICDERGLESETGASVELLAMFLQHRHQLLLQHSNFECYHEVNVCIELHADFYQVVLRCPSLPEMYDLFLVLPMFTASIGHPIGKAITRLCDSILDLHVYVVGINRPKEYRPDYARDPNLLTTGLDLLNTGPNLRPNYIPLWLSWWLREGRRLPGEFTGRFISLSGLPHREAQCLLTSLLHCDTSEIDSDRTWEIRFCPSSPQQVRLYFDTVLAANSYLAIRRGSLQATGTYSSAGGEPPNVPIVQMEITREPDFPVAISNAMDLTRIDYLMELVQEYSLPGIPDRATVERSVHHGEEAILSMVSMIRHLKPTFDALVAQNHDRMVAKMEWLRHIAPILTKGAHAIKRLEQDHYRQVVNTEDFRWKEHTRPLVQAILKRICQRYQNVFYLIKYLLKRAGQQSDDRKEFYPQMLIACGLE